MSDRPLIFITNDDGINAEGIHQLIGMAAPLGEIIAVVPDSPRSGGSTAITCGAILRPKSIRRATACKYGRSTGRRPIASSSG